MVTRIISVQDLVAEQNGNLLGCLSQFSSGSVPDEVCIDNYGVKEVYGYDDTVTEIATATTTYIYSRDGKILTLKDF